MKNEWIEVSAKSVEEAITEGIILLQTTTDKMEYEVLEKESSGFLGLFRHDAKIRVRLKEKKISEKMTEKPKKIEKTKPVEEKKHPVSETVKTEKTIVKKVERPVKEEKETVEEVKREPVSAETVEKAKEKARVFLEDVLKAMGLKTEIFFSFDPEENELVIDVKSDDMGILIGKRGQTLDSLQYIVSLVVNKECEEYLKIKLDSENYRIRRKETLENLAKNIASKVKRTGRQVSLEPMNSFERRIIHSALQPDDEIETYSEGNEPYRKVVVKLKGEKRSYGRYNKSYGGRKPYGKKPFGKSGGYRGSYTKYRKFDKEEEATSVE